MVLPLSLRCDQSCSSARRRNSAVNSRQQVGLGRHRRCRHHLRAIGQNRMHRLFCCPFPVENSGKRHQHRGSARWALFRAVSNAATVLAEIGRGKRNVQHRSVCRHKMDPRLSVAWHTVVQSCFRLQLTFYWMHSPRVKLWRISFFIARALQEFTTAQIGPMRRLNCW